MRNLVEVIDQMLEKIPESENSFLSSLEAIRTSTLFSAPETIRIRWKEVSINLAEFMEDKLQTEGWKREVQEIWMGEK